MTAKETEMKHYVDLNNKPFGGYTEEFWNKMVADQAFTEEKRKLLGRGQYLFIKDPEQKGYMKLVAEKPSGEFWAVGFRGQFLMWSKDLK